MKRLTCIDPNATSCGRLPFALATFALAPFALAIACSPVACSSTSDDPGSTPLPDGSASTQDSGHTDGGHVLGDTGTPVDSGIDPDVGPPEPVFDATALTVVGNPGLPLCLLSDDGRYLRISIKNAGTSQTFATSVRVATDGGKYELRVPTPPLAAAATSEITFDRGPLVGFVPDWHFTVTIDPDGKHGAPHAPVAGECTDLRSRAEAGMVPLATWYNTPTGLWDQNDWWTSANQLESVIDYSRETGDPQYIDEIDNTFTKNSSNNFDKYGYYDDDGWWALAWIKAYDLSHDQKYLDMAKVIFTRMTTAWDNVCGGGIYWAGPLSGSNSRTNKNAIPNELFLTAAARLHLRTPGDSGPGSYLDWAQREWAWFKGTGMITSNGQIVDGLDSLTACKPSGPVFTYNQGVVIGGLVDLAASTGDATLLDQASVIAHATMTKMADAKGTLVETPCGGDICVQFKGVFMRNLAYLYRARPLPEFQSYMRHQSDNLWTSNKNAQNQFGYEWQLPFDKATAGRQSSALDALIAAVRAANLNLALGATATGTAPCSDGPASNAIDGSARWGSKWCSGGAGNQTLSLDLGAPRYVVGFRVRHAGAGGENPAWNTRDFEIETSADGQTWAPAVAVTGNTDDMTTHPIPAVTARYVRLHVTQAQTATDFLAARIYELEVQGIAW